MPTNRKIALALLVLAFAGFADASYLTVEHFLGRIPPCSIAGSNCASVLTSSYAVFFGVPVSLIGAIYYLVLVLLSAIYYKVSDKLTILAFAGLSGLGVLASVGLVYVQLFILDATCLYCMFSAAISGSLAVLSLTLLAKSHYNQIEL